jgi:hypothetical protein
MMPLRKCASCGGDLPAGATARAKFCSTTCRSRAHRAGDAPLSLVAAPAKEQDDEPRTLTPRSTSRLTSLQSAAERLDKLLDQADPRSASALNKEYRETLREIEALSASGQEGQGADSRSRTRRPFDASAI